MKGERGPNAYILNSASAHVHVTQLYPVFSPMCSSHQLHPVSVHGQPPAPGLRIPRQESAESELPFLFLQETPFHGQTYAVGW